MQITSSDLICHILQHITMQGVQISLADAKVKTAQGFFSLQHHE
jgi:hypothetical protein